MKGFMVFLLFIPCVAQAAVYKCSSESDTYFSQIPCEENAEVVEFEDNALFSESSSTALATPEPSEPPADVQRTPADNLREFVETLQRQRLEQVEKIDENIIALEALMEASASSDGSSPEQARLVEQIENLNEERKSISDQYAAMISEAESRVNALGMQ